MESGEPGGFMKFSFFILMLLVVMVLIGIANATAGPAISISPPAVTLTSGSSVTYNFQINGLEAGLAGYQMQVKLTNPVAGKITNVSFPDWALASKASPLPSDNVTVSAIDLSQQIQEGASGVNLVSITVTAADAGTSNVRIENLTMEDDNNGIFSPDLVTARLTTLPSNGSVYQNNGTTVTPVMSTTLQPGVNQTSNQSIQTIVPTQFPTFIYQVVSPATTISVVATPYPLPQPETLQTPLYQRIPRVALYGFGLIAIIAAIALLYLGTTKKI